MVKVASCQLLPAPDVASRKDQMRDVLAKAEAEKVDFVCFPEGFLTGYYAEENLARESSLEVGDESFEEWLHICYDYSSTIIVGFNEKEGRNLFDSAAVIEKGRLLGIQRKHYLYHAYFTQGTSFSPFQSKGITFGVVICLDSIYFEPARLLALQGANILFCPTCNKVPLNHPYAKRSPYYSHLVARSFENRCWLVTADWIWPNDGCLICPGTSVIYDPDGKEIARSKEGEEQLLCIDISSDRLDGPRGRRVYGSPILVQELLQSAAIVKKTALKKA